ncbi:DUF3768 domain-containing protein [Falsihalocynthiibacter arcticus]|uniref:DUF3768 domain-containing protein n=1 Tax=Falsihalocynthiibacter arcticus TaxID=1579316 RepID=UPI0012E7D5EB|nr:DUF3768 domain-containing protein [Falsihalocynthiibacter arcticus]
MSERFRKLQSGGTIVAAPSVMDLGPHAVHEIISDVAAFDVATPDNDPYGECDFHIVT